MAGWSYGWESSHIHLEALRRPEQIFLLASGGPDFIYSALAYTGGGCDSPSAG